ncbi:MAG: cell division protein FtsH [Verrucomicrobia bacterium CG_4_9_14_3_um_filter_43_20]|nr:MAG: cell division protein FtsH [Verrucomicrobia bacterium CG1_02_43_26]PIP59988.1 MAG: cell division protein FtsH [Verrucomicrobia bacterium CG22_combo_CG10-13_8_21_14_all_43_17]PIY62744.1 MAG: cell division protein FtsH [Verrucomicrobia bacterium CG_4_10_14_0_8_um_filter_43_34]PJA43658.1 MAG: cell division protein FtsH [Verrucomicrobia bacterium CG_4_9_14_3_um_filter_43_20]
MEDEGNNTRRPKNNKQPERFQPKVLLIWMIIFAAIVGLWSMYPGQQGGRHETWTLQQVITAAESGRIEKATIKADPNRGPEWYVINGEANPALAGAELTEEAKEPIIFQAQGRLTEQKFNKLLDSKGGKNISEKPASTLMTDILMSLLPFVLIIALLYFFFVRQIKMAGKGAMSFGKSRAKMLTRDKELPTFANVAGCDEAKEEVSEIVEFLKDPKKFQRIGGRIPKGVLMVGPPGTGKTLLARAVAGEADVPFFSISGSDFVEMFVGVGAARVRDMFEQGKKNAPCILFIDEIDAVGRQRGAGLGGGNDEREQTLNSLLVEMDGFDAHDGVIIIAATNRPDVLDSALLRPGRFDRQVVIDLPDVQGREEILAVHAKKIKVSPQLDLSVVARNTPGFSGADLENLLNEAALVAARYNKEWVEPGDVDEARDKIAYGRERRKLMDEEDRKITAYHEAGHALIQAVIDDGYLPIHKVTIIPRGQSLGSTMFSPSKDILNHSRKHLLNQICCAMGGRIAEELTFSEITSGASGDIRMATKLARHMVCDWGMSTLGPVSFGENQDHIFLGKEISRNQNYSESTAQHIDSAIHGIIDTEYQRAETIIRDHRTELEKIAEALLKYETLEGKHVYEILKHGEIQSDVTKTPFGKPKPTTKKEETKTEEHKQGEELGPDSTANALA